MTLNEDSDIDVELKERYGSPDGLDVSIDGMNILLFYKLSWYFQRKQGRIQEWRGGGGGKIWFRKDCCTFLWQITSPPHPLQPVAVARYNSLSCTWILIVKDAPLEFSLVAKCNTLFIKKSDS